MKIDMQARTLVEAATEQVPMPWALRTVPAAQHLTDEHWERLAALATIRWQDAVAEARKLVEAVGE